MTAQEMVYDLVGVGFGPSNLALAIALNEAVGRRGRKFSSRFIEKQPGFTWHGGMLLPGSDMQISFLKDLVSLRDPSSRFTFLSYLHAKGRLQSFINRKTFYPSRVEFNDYLCWTAANFDDGVSYGEEVTAIEPETARGVVTHVAVHSRDRLGHERRRLARNLVLAVGGRPRIPDVFREAAGDKRVFHSSSYLANVGRLGLRDAAATRIAVVGRGQSAAEIMLDLSQRYPNISVDLIMRGFALRPSDASPFVNEIFDPSATDFIYQQPEKIRHSILTELRNTNYAVVDGELIETLYAAFYQQSVEGHERLRMLRMREIVGVAPVDGGAMLTIRDHEAGAVRSERYDGVILATGYERDTGGHLLDGLGAYLPERKVERNYRLKTSADFLPSIHLQGYSEATHGLSDTLLSVLPVRAEEIATSLLTAADARQSAA
jgi:L-ornithine N5-oxygenase